VVKRFFFAYVEIGFPEDAQGPCKKDDAEAAVSVSVSSALPSRSPLGLRSGFESPDLDRPGRLPHQQGPCETPPPSAGESARTQE